MLYDMLTPQEVVILDVLRGIIKDRLPPYCKEKLSFNVPFFYGHRGICILWPASIPGGGVNEGVLMGFWQANKLDDIHHYLTHGSNKKIYYKIFKHVSEIDIENIYFLLDQAIELDVKNVGNGQRRKL